MKSLRQIERWLESQEWYGQFCDNCLDQPEYGDYYNGRTPEDERRARMISNAFDWNHTPEGFGFWEKVNRDYLHWLTEGDFIEEASLMAKFD